MGMPSKRERKRHVQLDLLKKPRKRTKGVRLGRPPKGPRSGSPHKKRPTLKGRFPVHVVMRVAAELGSLRKRDCYKALRWATLTAARREDFRIVHISIQRTHVHMLVEAHDKRALSRGMQGFQISAAKLLNRAVSIAWETRRRGTVFTDRYHAEIITTRRQARHALAYVLNNWRKHREDREPFSREWKVDPYSTGALFAGWKERGDDPLLWKLPETYEPMFVWFPKTWLLDEGWRRYGLIGMSEVPSAPANRGR